ncbi:hypothetical protein IFM89_017308 [Coptis chinensis]|uniref:Embryo defective n=1 Tax=Coptis chinensis TaxID=261450 RepID=A0A835H953_9MAGN|nr:hypothetical protein IFM89_017308 [Coptis chinensis]
MESVAALNHTPSLLIGTKTRTRKLLPSRPPRMQIKGLGPYQGSSNLLFRCRYEGQYPFQNTTPMVTCAINMTEGDSTGPRRLNLDHILCEIKKVWKSLPQPVKSFPWPEALENFLELILGLVYAVAKYLSVPLLAFTSLSELSYCAHERKMRLVPIPLLTGIVVAGIFKDAALELYPQLKEGEFPWHLVSVAFFLVLLKLPGPYYPYWGRIFIPHFANGGLLRTLWSAIIWYKKPHVAPETTLPQNSTPDHQS